MALDGTPFLSELRVWAASDGRPISNIAFDEPILHFALGPSGTVVTGHIEGAMHSAFDGSRLATTSTTNGFGYGDAVGVSVHPATKCVALAVHATRKIAGGIMVWYPFDSPAPARWVRDEFDFSTTVFSADGLFLYGVSCREEGDLYVVRFRLDRDGRWYQMWSRRFDVPAMSDDLRLTRVPNPWYEADQISAAGLRTAIAPDGGLLAVAMGPTIAVVATDIASLVDLVDCEKPVVAVGLWDGALMSVLDDGCCSVRTIAEERSPS